MALELNNSDVGGGIQNEFFKNEKITSPWNADIIKSQIIR